MPHTIAFNKGVATVFQPRFCQRFTTVICIWITVSYKIDIMVVLIGSMHHQPIHLFTFCDRHIELLFLKELVYLMLLVLFNVYSVYDSVYYFILSLMYATYMSLCFKPVMYQFCDIVVCFDSEWCGWMYGVDSKCYMQCLICKHTQVLSFVGYDMCYDVDSDECAQFGKCYIVVQSRRTLPNFPVSSLSVRMSLQFSMQDNMSVVSFLL